MPQRSRVRRTLILILIATTLIVASVWIGGAWIVAVLSPLLSGPALWGASGTVAVLLATVPPLYVALRLLSAAGDRAPHRPTFSLSLLSLYNLGVLALILGLIPQPTGKVLEAQGRWLLLDLDVPLIEAGIHAVARVLDPSLERAESVGGDREAGPDEAPIDEPQADAVDAGS